MLLGRFAPRPGFICAKDLLLWAGLNQRSGVPWSSFLSSVLRWKIAPAHRIADGGGRVEGPQFFQHAVELALDLVQAAQDQRETVVGGHDFTASEEGAPAGGDGGMPGRGLSQQSGSNSASSLCGGGRSVLVLCFSHVTFGPISLSRFAHVRRLVHLRQRFVRRCHGRMLASGKDALSPTDLAGEGLDFAILAR